MLPFADAGLQLGNPAAPVHLGTVPAGREGALKAMPDMGPFALLIPVRGGHWRWTRLAPCPHCGTAIGCRAGICRHCRCTVLADPK